MKTLVDSLYSLIVGLAIVSFLGLGIYALYPGPQYEKSCYELYEPEFAPETRESASVTDSPIRKPQSPQETQAAYQKQEECLSQRKVVREAYAANVATIGLSLTALLLAAYWLIRTRPIASVLRDGLGLGVLAMGIYDISWSLAAGPHRILLFLSATATLVAAILLTYIKFDKSETSEK